MMDIILQQYFMYLFNKLCIQLLANKEGKINLILQKLKHQIYFCSEIQRKMCVYVCVWERERQSIPLFSADIFKKINNNNTHTVSLYLLSQSKTTTYNFATTNTILLAMQFTQIHKIKSLKLFNITFINLEFITAKNNIKNNTVVRNF